MTASIRVSLAILASLCLFTLTGSTARSQATDSPEAAKQESAAQEPASEEGLPAQAGQSLLPVATVCIAPLDRSLPDLRFILSSMKIPEISGMVELLTGFYTKGLDRSRPLGAFVMLKDDSPSILACLPVTDHQEWFQALGNMGLEPEDLGDGMYELAVANQFLIAKVENGWLFLAQSEEAVQSLPEDPEQLFGDLPDRYNVSVRVDLKEISPESRKSLLDEMKAGIEQGVAQQFGNQLGEQWDAARDAGDQLEDLEDLEEWINEVEQMILGVLVDSAMKKIYLDGAIQFMPGSTLAAQMDSQSDLQSNFAKLRLPESILNARITSEMATDLDKQNAKEFLETLIQQAQPAIARSGLPIERSALLKEFLAASTQVAEKTIDEGTIDLAMSMNFDEETIRVLLGATVADGRAIEEELKQFLTGLSETAELELEFDFEQYKDWNLHRIKAQLPESETGLSKMLGTEIELLVAGSEKIVLLSLAPEGTQALKAAIDQVESQELEDVTPVEMTLRLTGFLQLMQKISPDETLDDLAQSVTEIGGEDEVKVTATMLPRGMVLRVAVDTGILQMAGKMAKQGNLVPGF
jgi:hypothetical protein